MKSSPFKQVFGANLFTTIPASAGSLAGGFSAPGTGGFLGLIAMVGMAHMAKARATMRKLSISRGKEYAARNEMNRYKNIYESLHVTNPYSNLKNPFVGIGLNVDRRKAQFERDQFQQQQANMMGTMQQSGGGSGMANRVKLLSQMGMEAGVRSAASIGQQESQVRLLQPQMFAKIDQLERSGRNISAMFEKDKYAKLMGMSQMEMFGYMENKYNQEQAKAKNFEGMMNQFSSLAGSTASRWQSMPGQSTPSANTNVNEFA